jgi:hypothetical protein
MNLKTQREREPRHEHGTEGKNHLRSNETLAACPLAVGYLARGAAFPETTGVKM